MAKKSFNKRFPTFKWFLVFAIALSIPITLFSLNTQTQTRSNANGDTWDANCSSSPKWTLVNHTDYASSVKYKLTLTSNCPNISAPTMRIFNEFSVWAKIPTGWSYKYQLPLGSNYICVKNQTCNFTIWDKNSTTVFLTISRPSTVKAGTYTIPIYAQNFNSPIAIKNLSYIVIK